MGLRAAPPARSSPMKRALPRTRFDAEERFAPIPDSLAGSGSRPPARSQSAARRRKPRSPPSGEAMRAGVEGPAVPHRATIPLAGGRGEWASRHRSSRPGRC
jgi:hypothetical protein